MHIKVNLYRTFKEDKRVSMDVYSDYLDYYIKKKYSSTIDISSFVPAKLISRFFPDKFKMRFARYIEYPYQIKKNHQKYNVDHIVDHGYSHLIKYPLCNKNTIVTVHDLIPLLSWKGLIPNYYYPHRPRLIEYSLKCLKDAAHVIAVSQNTKKDLIEHCGLKKENISVIYNGCGELFRPLLEDQKKKLRIHKFKFPQDSFLILITGGYYKNHETALKVLEELRLKKNNVYIVKLGHQDQDWNRLKNNFSLNRYIIELDWLKLNEVSELYNSVDCLLFPSFYEGFGLPPLEAMASGLPVVASNAASIPEVVDKAGLLYNPNDVKGMIQGINLIMNDKKIRKEIIDKGIKQSLLFTWDESIEKLVNVYKSVISKNNGIKL
jgi:glycosyltransferase involved in cell wall biosynthesis